MRKGAAADIWYDAREHGDSVAELAIDKTKDAMAAAASLIEDLLRTTKALLECPAMNEDSREDADIEAQTEAQDLMREIECLFQVMEVDSR